MKDKNQRAACLPTRQEEFLLKAALMEPPASILAWEKWIGSTDIDQIDYGSQCMLPLVTNNLRSQGFSHPALTKFKGIYRQTWYRNQMHMTELASVIKDLHKAGIKTMVLKGVALLVTYYKDFGLRILGDIDLLVEPQDFSSSIQIVLDLGWEPENDLDKFTEENLRYVREIHFFRQNGVGLDLHSHILFENPNAAAESDFWRAAAPITIRDQQSSALNPADQLLHLCVHGLKWDALPSFRWVADCVLIQRAEPYIDWDRLICQSEKWGVVTTMKVALHYLAQQLDAPIPDDVLTNINQLTIPGYDRRQHQIYNSTPNLFTSFQKRYFVFSRFFVNESNFLERYWGFLRFIQHTWQVKKLIWMPLQIFKKGILRLVRFLPGFRS